jgi:hypothetical protein
MLTVRTLTWAGKSSALAAFHKHVAGCLAQPVFRSNVGLEACQPRHILGQFSIVLAHCILRKLMAYGFQVETIPLCSFM